MKSPSSRVVLPAAGLNYLVMKSFSLLYHAGGIAPLCAGRSRGRQRVLLEQHGLDGGAVVSDLRADVCCSRAADHPSVPATDTLASGTILAILSVGFYFHAAAGLNGTTLKVLGKVRYRRHQPHHRCHQSDPEFPADSPLRRDWRRDWRRGLGDRRQCPGQVGLWMASGFNVLRRDCLSCYLLLALASAGLLAVHLFGSASIHTALPSPAWSRWSSSRSRRICSWSRRFRDQAVAASLGAHQMMTLLKVAAIAAIYSNVPVLAIHFHGVPAPLAGLVMFLLVVPLVYESYIRRERIIVDRTFLLMLGFLAALCAASLLARDVPLALKQIGAYLAEGVLLYLLVLNVFRDWTAIRRGVWAMPTDRRIPELARPLSRGHAGLHQHIWRSGAAQGDHRRRSRMRSAIGTAICMESG